MKLNYNSKGLKGETHLSPPGFRTTHHHNPYSKHHGVFGWRFHGSQGRVGKLVDVQSGVGEDEFGNLLMVEVVVNENDV